MLAPEVDDAFVMDFAWLIDRRAAELMKMLMAFEQADVVVISKLSELDEKTITLHDDIFAMDSSTSGEVYASFLARNCREAVQKSPRATIARPWAVFAKRIAACTE